MTDAEGLMWRLEADPAFSSNVATITLLDQPADVDRLRRRFERAVALLPRLRQRVMERPLGLPPVWVDVTDVDLDHHFRHVALPAPGSMRQLFDLVTTLLSDPFDPTRPLWELHVIDGVEGGQGAVVQKMHHTVTDGENGLRISMQFLDLERYAQDLPRLTDAQLAAAAPDATADAGRFPPRGHGQRHEALGGGRAPGHQPPAQPGPRGRAGCHGKPDGAQHRVDAGRQRAGQFDALVEALDSPPLRRPGGAVRAGEAGRQRAGRHAERRLPDGGRRRRRRLPPRARLTRGQPAGVDGHQHPHEGIGRECVHTGPAAGANR